MPLTDTRQMMLKLASLASPVLFACCLQAQTLAHKGWAGSGLTVDPWWKNAVFYQLDPQLNPRLDPLALPDSKVDGSADLKQVTDRLDSLQALGVDAVVLSPIHLQLESVARESPIMPADGTLNAFDQLEQEASRRRIRLIVDLPLTSIRPFEETLAAARFWLSRGVAGLRLTSPSPTADANAAASTLTEVDRLERVSALRHLCAGYAGDRLLLWDVPNADPPGSSTPVATRRRRGAGSPLAGPQLWVDRTMEHWSSWNADALRALLEPALPGGGVRVSDGPAQPRSWDRLRPPQLGALPGDDEEAAKIVAAVLLLGRESPMIFSGQETEPAYTGSRLEPTHLGGDDGFTAGAVREAPGSGTSASQEKKNPRSLLNWYRRLDALRHSEGALHGGTVTLVDTGYQEVVAWLRRGSNEHDQPLLVVCNMTSRPVLLSLTEALKRASARANSGIQPVAVSFSGNPSYTASGISLPGYGVYVGQLIQPGLEDSPAPMPLHRRGR